MVSSLRFPRDRITKNFNDYRHFPRKSREGLTSRAPLTTFHKEPEKTMKKTEKSELSLLMNKHFPGKKFYSSEARKPRPLGRG
jgi:hypothetical protein